MTSLTTRRSSATKRPDPPILTIKQVADLFQLSTRTIYNLIPPRGSLPCARVGGSLRFLRGDVLRWFEARKEGNDASTP